MFPPYQINRTEFTRLIQRKLAEIEEFGANRVLLENPSTKAKFPVCVMSAFIAVPRRFKTSYNLSVTAEVWADKFYEAEALYDLVWKKMGEINFVEAAPTPQGKDIVTGKQRCGCTFEAGWDAITNTFFVNRS